ncbi:YcxB family protein [Pedobacter frigiditerrae]|uniref:YcxB family protein n=1 Tax=Pedobacter frigiditerrae TaxID=2530452 RepID=UPI00292D34BF|nr:YcxB family protein [Pedobacter frigiditerrae]
MQITLNYTYTQDQLKMAYRFNVFPTPKAKYFMLLFSCFIFGLGGLFWLLLKPNESNAQVLNILQFILMMSWIFWSLMLMVAAINYYCLPIYAFRKSPFYKGNFTVNLITQGLAYKQQLSEQNSRSERDGFVYWGAFAKKAENDEFIFLFINKKHYILPKASFKNNEELEEFRLFLTKQKHIMTKRFNGTEIWNHT